MIKSFADARTEQIFKGLIVKRMSPDLQKQALRRLQYIEAATRIEDLRLPPSNRLERKQGDLKDFYAIWINAQWRIVFRWDEGAYDVQIVDYH